MQWFIGLKHPGITWQVYGEHWIMRDGMTYLLGQELITDCSIYNGWWDYNL